MTTPHRLAGDSPVALGTIINRIAGAMREGAISPGDLAELRRLDVEAPNQPAFWKTLAWITPEGYSPHDQETAWAIVLSGMARMAPLHHCPGNSVGMVLAEMGLKEGRLMRMLRSQGTTFAATVRRTCGFLASRGQPVDWTEFAAFILTRDPDQGEERRRKIARDYYAALQRKE